MKELKYVIILLNIIIFDNVKSQQILPQIACLDLLQYQVHNKDNQYYGLLRINNPNTSIVKLSVNLSIVDSVTTDVKLMLLHSRQKTLKEIKQNKSIDYKVEFSPSQHTPRLIAVTVNDVTLCNDTTENNLIAKSITLDHILQTQIINSSLDNAEFLTLLNETTMSPKNDFGFTPQQTDSIQESISQSVDVICGTIATKNIYFADTEHTLMPSSWPWLAAIFEDDGIDYNYKCGGTLVSSKIVLSPAHCLQWNHIKVPVEKLLITLGRHNLNNWTEPTTMNNLVKEVAVHADFRTGNSYDADIAVVVLIDTVTFTVAIHPACLWTIGTNDNIYNDGLVVGWGYNGTKNSTPSQVATRIVSDDDCVSSFIGFYYVISNRTFCAGFQNGTGPCDGDLGSALVVKYSNNWYLRGFAVGTIIDDMGNCNLQEYAIYTDVTKYLTWIYSYIDTYG